MRSVFLGRRPPLTLPVFLPPLPHDPYFFRVSEQGELSFFLFVFREEGFTEAFSTRSAPLGSVAESTGILLSSLPHPLLFPILSPSLSVRLLLLPLLQFPNAEGIESEMSYASPSSAV